LRDVIRAFEDVGVSRSVELDETRRRTLLGVLEGLDDSPPRLSVLRNALGE
jgi:hypothetical protein